LIGKRYKEEKKEQARPKIEIKEQTVSPLLSKNSQVIEPLKTAYKIAEQAKVIKKKQIIQTGCDTLRHPHARLNT